MASVNPLSRELVFKVVYYGPGLGGKTTTLEHIHATAKPDHRGKLVSLATPVDRTLYFDFLPMRLPPIRGMHVRLQLFTVPGQVYFNATRKLVLTGADGIVFVADSQTARADANLESLDNLRDNLADQGRNLNDVPIVFQYNKYDLADVLSVAELDKLLNPSNAPSLAASARTGLGVYEGLEKITHAVLASFETQMPESVRVAAAAAYDPHEEGLAAALRGASQGEDRPPTSGAIFNRVASSRVTLGSIPPETGSEEAPPPIDKAAMRAAALPVTTFPDVPDDGWGSKEKLAIAPATDASILTRHEGARSHSSRGPDSRSGESPRSRNRPSVLPPKPFAPLIPQAGPPRTHAPAAPPNATTGAPKETAPSHQAHAPSPPANATVAATPTKVTPGADRAPSTEKTIALQVKPPTVPKPEPAKIEVVQPKPETAKIAVAPVKPEPPKHEPAKIEVAPVKPEPPKHEPAKVEVAPVKPEPPKHEPAKIEVAPVKPEPPKHEPAKIEVAPVKPEPPKHEPAKVEVAPVKPEPPKHEPAKVEVAPVKPEPPKHEPAKVEVAPVKPEPPKHEPAKVEVAPAKPEPTKHEPPKVEAAFAPPKPEPPKHEPAKIEVAPAKPEPPKHEPEPAKVEVAPVKPERLDPTMLFSIADLLEPPVETTLEVQQPPQSSAQRALDSLQATTDKPLSTRAASERVPLVPSSASGSRSTKGHVPSAPPPPPTRPIGALATLAEARTSEPSSQPAASSRETFDTNFLAKAVASDRPDSRKTGLSFAELWPEADRSLVHDVEAAIAAGKLADAIELSDSLVTRVLTSTATLFGSTDVARDASNMPYLLGIDGRRYLAFRSIVRAARSGAKVSTQDALGAYAFALEARMAKSSVR